MVFLIWFVAFLDLGSFDFDALFGGRVCSLEFGVLNFLLVVFNSVACFFIFWFGFSFYTYLEWLIYLVV